MLTSAKKYKRVGCSGSVVTRSNYCSVVSERLKIERQGFNAVINPAMIWPGSVANRPGPVSNDWRVGEQIGAMLYILSKHIPSVASCAIANVECKHLCTSIRFEIPHGKISCHNEDHI